MKYLGSCQHTVHRHQHHNQWDNALPPVLVVDPPATVEFEVTDASGGELHRGSSVEDVAKIDFGRINPVTGPVAIAGAMPGDVLEVEILEFSTFDWGWTAIIPGFGLLADQFPDPWFKSWELAPGARTAVFGDRITIPIAPFPGVIGVAPPEPGQHSIVPPREWGGNLDMKHLVAGTRLYLPVGVPDALFSVGDTHAAQGDGEVCGTAIEASMQVALRFRLYKQRALRRPMVETPGGAENPIERYGALATTGVASDLMEAARQSVEAMIDLLVDRTGVEAAAAYALASVAVDLRVHEVVDAPNWVVGAWLPKSVVRGILF